MSNFIECIMLKILYTYVCIKILYIIYIYTAVKRLIIMLYLAKKMIKDHKQQKKKIDKLDIVKMKNFCPQRIPLRN